MAAAVSNMLNKLHGQPETYDKKYVFANKGALIHS